MLRYTDIILVTWRNPSKTGVHNSQKDCMLSLVATSCKLFCEAQTYQNKTATIRSDNTKSDVMKIVFNCSAGVDGKEKRWKQ